VDLKELLGGSAIPMRKEDLGKVIGTSPDTYKDLIQLTFSKDMPACWRAAWMMDYLAELDPALPEIYIAQIWEWLPENHPDGVKRSTLRMLCRYDIPEEQQGMATDLCLDWLIKESIPVAVKAYSMEIMHKITILYPEIKDVVIAILQDHMDNNTVGFMARARHIIRALEKL
jgi:hypothetical protein